MLTLFLLLAIVSAVTGDVCPEKVVNTEKYHGDQTCNREGYHSYKEGLCRHLKYKKLKESQTAGRVPSEKTVVCPSEVQPLHEEGQVTGFDTMWLVENTASVPVIVSFPKEDGLEYSAFNSKITPPQADEKGIIQPGQWKAVHTYEGHTFHVHEVMPDGSLGQVLLQHRVGLINIGAFFSGECSLDDPEPIKNNTSFARTKTHPLRRCNQMDVGFRNVAGCPLHAYWIGKGQNMTDCKENFKFHLGVDPSAEDFMWSWGSPTKFEGTFAGHTFSFRLAGNPSVLVDTVTLAPTQIVDCPDLQQKAWVSYSSEPLILPVDRFEARYANLTGLGGNATAFHGSAALPIGMSQPF